MLLPRIMAPLAFRIPSRAFSQTLAANSLAVGKSWAKGTTLLVSPKPQQLVVVGTGGKGITSAGDNGYSRLWIVFKAY
jgi:hypothetical protein